jgi:hypothetical protein
MNQQMYNAMEEGGPRNGVMTAFEDYLSQSDIEWKILHIPMYFGVTLLATTAMLEAKPALRAQYNRLEQQLQGKALIEAGEQLRIAEGIAFQRVHRDLQEAKSQIAVLEAELARLKDQAEGA